MISSVVVANTATVPVVTWNVADVAGIQSATMTVDGTSMLVCGPYGSNTNANYAGLLGVLTAGSHTFTITATDDNGVATSSSSAFVVSGIGPTISGITFNASAATPVITWNVADGAGIQSATITVNGTNMSVYGPYGTTTSANFSAELSNLSTTGSNSYVITATGFDGVSTSYGSTITVGGVGPTFSSIVVAPSAATPVITWNAADGFGIQSVAFTVDGTQASVCGPYGTNTSGTFAGLLGRLPAGDHNFTITATDSNGYTTTYAGAFTVNGVSPTISSVVVAPRTAMPVITWNVADSAGIQSWTMAVDGTYAPLYGPYGAATNANFAAGLGTLSTAAIRMSLR